MKSSRKWKKELIVRALFIVAGLLLAFVVGKASAETVVLSVEECVSVGPAMTAQLRFERYEVAISPNAQRLTDSFVKDFREGAAREVQAGRMTPEEVVEMINGLSDHIAMLCIQYAMVSGGEIVVEFP